MPVDPSRRLFAFLLAVVLALVLYGSADAHGGVVVRRGVFGRSVVVQRGFVPQHNFSRDVFIDPRFDSRGFHPGGRVVFDRFGRAIIIR
jgi:hypothetical protein